MHERPALPFAARKYVAEQFFGLSAIEEVLLVGGTLIGIARRDRYPDAKLLRVIEKGVDVFGRVSVIDRGVDVDRKTFRLGGLDRGYRAIEYARLADRLVVMLAQAIEVNGEE